MTLCHVVKLGRFYMRLAGRWSRGVPAAHKPDVYLSFDGRQYAFVEERRLASLFTEKDAGAFVKKAGTVRGLMPRVVKLVKHKARAR